MSTYGTATNGNILCRTCGGIGTGCICDTTTVRDNLGVAIETTDTVMVTAWGGTTRLIDTGIRSRVVRVNRSRVVIIDADGCERAVTPSTVQVLRRDGVAGFEGNRIQVAS